QPSTSNISPSCATLRLPPPPTPPLFPYTTLFRSQVSSLIPRTFSPGGFIAELVAAYDDVSNGRGGQQRMLDVYRVFVIRSQSPRSEEHTSELQSRSDLVCRRLLEKKNTIVIEIGD